jgi:hypothetical protein
MFSACSSKQEKTDSEEQNPQEASEGEQNYIDLAKQAELDLKYYKPVKEFAPAYQILEEASATKETNTEYDIEETVRILNGLEMAQSQSEDFYSFLEYMTKQDYSQVAGDVTEAKMKLLPVLQQMFKLQKEHKELSDIWPSIVKKAPQALPILISLGSAIIAKNPANLKTAATVAVPFINDIFEDSKEKKKLSEPVKNEIERLKMAYLDYLTEFTPVYIKYMKEWDRLCINKDKAYFDVYSGRMVDAYNSAFDILEKYPRNREALLLKSLALIYIASGNINIDGLKTLSIPQDAGLSIQVPEEIRLQNANERRGWNKFYIEADVTLDYYKYLYPEHSAPAFVLKGLLYQHVGKETQAFSFLDQAAMEYPRQAERLTDLLDSYRTRTYLNKTAEGQYLLGLYRSTMEGYGMFSPNFMKAQYYAQKRKITDSEKEIFQHFLRRSNQGLYDNLLADLQYCENYLYSSFKQLLMEHSYIDVSIARTKDWKFTNKDDEIEVKVDNRSDLNLENVRIFLCIHYTDMNTDEYDVIKVPITKNRINQREIADLGTVKLKYEDKKYDDITRVRAIVVTDDKIGWIDEVKYKETHPSMLLSKGQYGLSTVLSSAKEHFLQDLSLDAKMLQSLLLGVNVEGVLQKAKVDWLSLEKVKDIGSSVSAILDDKDKSLTLDLPRMLTLIDPVFSIHQIQDKDKVILPKENYLAGSSIRLKFDYKPKKGEKIPLYIYSDFVNYKVDMLCNENGFEIKNVEIVNEAKPAKL